MFETTHKFCRKRMPLRHFDISVTEKREGAVRAALLIEGQIYESLSFFISKEYDSNNMVKCTNA